MRGTKVGDVVVVRRSAGRESTGTIVYIEPDGNRLRRILTLDGEVWAAPDDIVRRSDEPDHTVPVTDVEVGDVVVMFEGTQRRVTGGRREQGTYVLTLHTTDGSWPWRGYLPAERLYVIR